MIATKLTASCAAAVGAAMPAIAASRIATTTASPPVATSVSVSGWCVHFSFSLFDFVVMLKAKQQRRMAMSERGTSETNSHAKRQIPRKRSKFFLKNAKFPEITEAAVGTTISVFVSSGQK